MTPEELHQCLEKAFGDLEPPFFNELGYFYPFESFLEVVKTDTARTKRWQELRPLRQYLHGSLDLLLLAAGACQYYLPAYLYAMTDSENVWCYLSSVLDTLWYEDEYGEPLHNNPDLRGRWEEFASLLTDPQKRCIAHCLVEILKGPGSTAECAEVQGETDRIEYMLKRYWTVWL